MNNKPVVMYNKYVNQFILGSGYVMQPPILMTEAEMKAETIDGIYQNVRYVRVEPESVMPPMTIGYYVPSPAFLAIMEHVCIMRQDDQEVIAIMGSSADDDELPSTMHYARLFLSAPAILDQNQRATSLIDRLDSMIEEAMGEWISVSSTWMPAGMLELAQMRDAIQEYNSEGVTHGEEEKKPPF